VRITVPYRQLSVTESLARSTLIMGSLVSDHRPSMFPPSLTPIERPRCPKCDTRMSVARIMPGPKGYEYRNFECSKCDHVETRTVSVDPLKSEAAGWLAGELKPPK
jgi:hypothetical protein